MSVSVALFFWHGSFFPEKCPLFSARDQNWVRCSISEQQKRRGGGGWGEGNLFSILDLLSLFSKMSHSHSDLCLVSPHLELL